MKHRDEFDIHLIGLNIGVYTFEYKLLPSFFERFDYPNWESSEVAIKIQLEKQENFFEITLIGRGWVEVLCDRTGELFRQEINPKSELLVKYGNQTNLLDDQVWIIEHGKHSLNLSKFIFEVVVLSLPEKRIHPSVIYDDENIEFCTNKKSNRSKNIDPRWEVLNKLLKITKE